MVEYKQFLESALETLQGCLQNSSLRNLGLVNLLNKPMPVLFYSHFL